MTSDARDVIARAIFDTDFPEGVGFDPLPPGWYDGMSYEYTDAILASLRESGYEVTKRDQPLPPTPGPYNPFGKQDGE